MWVRRLVVIVALGLAGLLGLEVAASAGPVLKPHSSDLWCC